MRARAAGRWGRPLACGPFTGERYQGSLRWLRVDDCEFVRMVGLVVRDRAWRTLAPVSLRERRTARGWSIAGRTNVGRGSLAWQLDVAGRPDGIDVRATMTAVGDVVTNRAGIVVLLPASTFAGATFVAAHVNGATTRGRLTREICPHQPMIDLRSARFSARGGPALALTFEGDVFEMEDQRNWLDPSYKLYSRALSRPFPYRIRSGAQVEQRVTIDLVRGPGPARHARHAVRRGVLPSLGIATAPDRVPADGPLVDALRELSPAFVLHRTDHRGRGLAAAARLATSLGAALRVEAFGDGVALASALEHAKPQSVAAYLPGPNVERALARCGAAHMGGTFADFVMVNRNGIAPDAVRATFALCPTVHARDDRSLIESLDTLPALFAQARRIAGARPLDAGPCSLLRRLLPKTGEPAIGGPGGIGHDYDVDPRQYALIAAAWLATTIAIAAAEGVGSLCAFEAVGARGLVRSKTRSGRDGGERSNVDIIERSPAHAVLAALAGRGNDRVTLLGLDAQHGAAFVLEGATAELWLVDLGGRARAGTSNLHELGTVRHLASGQGGARWRAPRSTGRVNSYSIVRVGLPSARTNRARDVALAWCTGSARA